jgi:hypothetical protein
VQSPALLSEAVVGEAMEVVMDLLLLCIVSACVFLTLAFLIAVAVGVVAELRSRGRGRNALPHRT